MNMDDHTMHRIFLIIVTLLVEALSQGNQYSTVPESSPCPRAFTYEVENSIPGRWYGIIHVNTDVTLYGVWINVILDKQADALASSFGEVTSTDNRDFKLENTKQTLTPSTQFEIRIYVNYNAIYTAPKLRSLRLNGRELCATGFLSHTTQPYLNKRSTNVYDGRRDNYYPTSNPNPYRDIAYTTENPRSSNVGRNLYDESSITRTRKTEVNSEPQDTIYRRRESSTTEQDNYDRRSVVPNGGFRQESRGSFEENTNNRNRDQASFNDNNNQHGYIQGNTNNNRETQTYNDDRITRPRQQSSNRDNERSFTNNNNDDRYNEDRRIIGNEGVHSRDVNSDNTRRNTNRDEYGFNQDRRTNSREETNRNNGNRRTNSDNNDDDDAISKYALSNVGGPVNRGHETSTTRRHYDEYDRPAATTTARNRPITTHFGSSDYDREARRPSGRVSPLSPSIINDERDKWGQKRTSSVSTQTHSQNSNDRRPSQHNNSDEDYDDDSSSSRKPNHHRIREPSNDYFEGDHNIPDTEKIHPTPISHSHNEGNHDQNHHQQLTCGKVAIRATPLIVSGEIAVQGQWPWHVALYQSQTVDSKYICGGSLISLNHVLTAAHCVTRKTSTRPVNPQTLTLYLGKYNLRKASDGVQIMLVRRISIHPEYNATNFYADLGVLKMTRRAEYSSVVRPVCLWRESEKDLSNVIGKEGSVAGWGFDENDSLQEDLAVVRMPVVKQTTCLWSFKEFFSHFTSNHSYCAGYANGTSVCNGDSGGGMVFPITDYSSDSNNPTWYLRGVVSISVARQNDSTCDPYHYVVFTDVAQYLDWIQQKIT